MSRWFWPCQATGHAAIARSRIVSESSGTMELFCHLIDPALARGIWDRHPSGVLVEKDSA